MVESVCIQDLRPRTPDGAHPAKAVVGERVSVSADIFKDGHEVLAARVRFRPKGGRWIGTVMQPVDNHRWQAVVIPQQIGMHEYLVEAWTDPYRTWRRDVALKHQAGRDIDVELQEGAILIESTAARLGGEGPGAGATAVTCEKAAATMRNTGLGFAERLAPADSAAVTGLFADSPNRDDLSRSLAMLLWVDRPRALFGSWYELFPRSCGGLEGTTKRLPVICDMGFDVLYLPPVHPIGHTDRKGRNNAVAAGQGDPGSPWAIGSEDGGHTAIDPGLGSFEDFDRLVDEASGLGMEIALDYALQCSPDHPWVAEHPEWFHRRPDGSIKFAENPPKQYQDIYPINFWPGSEADRWALWEACREIVDFWIGHGIKIFRVDNPHTKPLAFWDWMIPAIQAVHPDVIFLAEAFTHPKMMARLAEVGFTQSYTYFTWRTNKQELSDYAMEVAHGPASDYMRPNFWPNTPDILSGPLRRGGPPAFRLRALLAATMSPSYGIYSGYEVYENEPARDTDEEYLNSEKYEIKQRDWDTPGNMSPFLARLNAIRRAHPCLQELRNIRFHHAGNQEILAYSKVTADLSDVVLVVANLDPYRAQSCTLGLDLGLLGLDHTRPFTAIDELTGDVYTWNGPNPYILLDPVRAPAHILHLAQPPGTAAAHERI